MFTGTRVRHSLESLSQSPFSLLSSLRHYTKNAGSPTFYGFFVATRLCTASLLVATSFSCLFLMYLYTRISLKRAYFLLKRPRCSLTDARSARPIFTNADKRQCFCARNASWMGREKRMN